jgi:hypothetical protein
MKTPSMPSTLQIASSCRCFSGFRLHQHADFLAGPIEVVLDPAEARGAGGPGDTAQSIRRKSRVGHGILRLFFRLHVRQQQRLRADVEATLDPHHVVPRRANDWCSRAAGGGHQLAVQRSHVVG